MILQRQDLTVRPEQKEISLYSFGSVDAKIFAEQIIRLRNTFPKLSDGWFKELDLTIDRLGFDNRKFIDAVDSLIENFEYPEPSIANLIKFDKKIDLKTYNDILPECSPGINGFEKYQACNIDGELFYVKKTDLIKYKIKLPEWQVQGVKSLVNVKYPYDHKKNDLEDLSINKHLKNFMEESKDENN